MVSPTGCVLDTLINFAVFPLLICCQSKPTGFLGKKLGGQKEKQFPPLWDNRNGKKRDERGELGGCVPGGLHRGRACDRGSDGPLGSMSVIQTFWLRKRAHLCLVLNEVQLGCSDVSEDSYNVLI